MVGHSFFGPETYASDEPIRAGFRQVFVVRLHVRSEKTPISSRISSSVPDERWRGGAGPGYLRRIQTRRVRGFLLSRVGRGHDLTVACSVANTCGLWRHDKLVGVVVVGAFVYEVRHVSL